MESDRWNCGNTGLEKVWLTLRHTRKIATFRASRARFLPNLAFNRLAEFLFISEGPLAVVTEHVELAFDLVEALEFEIFVESFYLPSVSDSIGVGRVGVAKVAQP